MNATNRAKAIEIVTASPDINVKFNVPVTDNMSNVHDILILRSNATVINQLVAAGFSLHMTEKGLSVEKY